MSDWTHNICAHCWRRREPERLPSSIIEAPEELCCFCGQANQDGIYIRHDPKDSILKCDGDHEPEMIVG